MANINGTSNGDLIVGTGSADTINGNGGDDIILAGGGNDTVNGGNGNDIISGGDGHDTLNGDAGNDVITGDAGNDTLNGGAGGDNLAGGTGDDRLIGGTGDDALDGGTGIDVAEYTNVVGAQTVIRNANGTVTIQGATSGSYLITFNANGSITVSGNGQGIDTLTNIENLKIGNTTYSFNDLRNPPANQPPSDILLNDSANGGNPADNVASVREDAAVGTVVGIIQVVDTPGNTQTLTLNDPSGKFAIVGNELRVVGALNFEAQSAFTISITATDQGGLSRTETYTINVTNVNEAPTDILLSNASVAENAAGAVIGNLSVVDPDAANTHTFAVSDARFEVVAGQLKLKAGQALDFEAAPSVAVTVTATDQGGLAFTKAFTVNVTNVNEAPTNILLSNASVAENAAGAVIGNLSVVDPDAANTHTFAVSDARFEVVAGQLKLKAGQALDFEATPSIPVTVTATDQGGLAFTKAFTINVTNVNEAPTNILLSNNTITENAAGAIIGTLTALDPDVGDTHTFAVLNDSRFEVVGNQLKLRPGVAIDAELEPTVVMDIAATDANGLFVIKTFSIVIQNINEAPTNILLSNASVNENAPGAVVGALTIFDPDVGDTHTLAVNDARFEVVGGQLKLKAGESLDFERGHSVNLSITATDAGGLSFTKAFTIAVNNVVEPFFSTNADFANFIDGSMVPGTFTGSPNDALAGNDFVVLPALMSTAQLFGFTFDQPNHITFNGGDGNDTLLVGQEPGSPIVAYTINGGNGNDILLGGGANDTLNGGDGGDTFLATGGTNILTGGTGTDLLDYSTSAGPVQFGILGSGSGAIAFYANALGGAELLTQADIEQVFGSQFNDTMGVVTANNGLISALDGNDRMLLGSGTNLVNGGNGIDTADYGLSNVGIVAGPQLDGSYQVVRSTGTDTLVSIEKIVGSSLSDSITAPTGSGDFVIDAGGGNDILIGGAGNDTLIGGVGADSFDGGAGQDTVDYSNNVAAITASTSTLLQYGYLNGEGNFERLVNIERIIGSSFGDTLATQAGSTGMILEGGDGNDALLAAGDNHLLLGGNGNDTLSSINGNITLDGGAGTDTADFSLNATAVTSVQVSPTEYQIVDQAGHVTHLSNIEKVVGSNFDDVIKTPTGFANFVIDGAGGNDSFSASTGVNTLLGGTGIDTLDYSTSLGPVTYQFVVLSGSANIFVQNALGGTEILSNVDLEHLIGTDFNDVLGVTASDNGLILGNGGDDTILLGFGNNLVNGGSGSDTASYAVVANAGIVAGPLLDGNYQVTTQRAGVTGTDTLVSIEKITGSNFDDSFIAPQNTSNFTINGAGGADVVDFSQSATAINSVQVSPTEYQIVDQAGHTTTLLNVERLVGTAFDDVLKSPLGNTITSLDGGAGNDTFIGGAGSDTFAGRAGVDTVDYSGATGGITFTGVSGSLLQLFFQYLDDAGSTDAINSVENLIGSHFNDVLASSLENNTLTGNGGQDTFLVNFSLPPANDLITDFNADAQADILSFVNTLDTNADGLKNAADLVALTDVVNNGGNVQINVFNSATQHDAAHTIGSITLQGVAFNGGADLTDYSNINFTVA